MRHLYTMWPFPLGMLFYASDLIARKMAAEIVNRFQQPAEIHHEFKITDPRLNFTR